MIELMRFWLFSGFLLAGAAWSVDTLLRHRGAQLRGVWAAAMGLTLLSPVLPRLAWFASAPQPVRVPAATTDVAVPALAFAREAPSLLGFVTDPLILGAWALVSGALLLTGGVVLLRIKRQARTWRPERIREQEVLVAPDFGPAVVGISHPAIVLPERLSSSREEDLDLILRHEREHIEARDPWLLLASATAVALMPWNVPLVWQAFRLRAAVEEDCDARVLRAGVNARNYGDLLVRMACSPSGFGFAAAAMSERPSGLRRRLERLRNQSGQTRVALTALLVIAGAGAIGVWMGMPSPVSIWSGHGHGTTTVDLPFGPEAPVAPQPPVVFDRQSDRAMAEKLARLRERLAQQLERVEGDSRRAVTKYEEALEQFEQISASTGAADELAEAERALDRARRNLEAHQRLLAEIRNRFQATQPSAAELEAALPENARFRLEGGRIQIRAPEGSGEGKPLVYVDGVRISGDLEDIDPNTVERIEIIKDEAARALYGDAGENGVVQIYLKESVGGSGRN